MDGSLLVIAFSLNFWGNQVWILNNLYNVQRTKAQEPPGVQGKKANLYEASILVVTMPPSCRSLEPDYAASPPAQNRLNTYIWLKNRLRDIDSSTRLHCNEMDPRS